MASSHHDWMRGAMLCCPGVTFCSSEQRLKLYEPPIDKQHKYEQNLKRIMRQSLVDVGLSIARPSDLFEWLYTLRITLLKYCRCRWPGDATNEVFLCYCIKPFNPEHPDLNTRNIDFLRKWHLHYNDVIMSAMASQLTSLTIAYSIVYSGADQIKHQSCASLAFVRGIHRWPAGLDIRKFHPRPGLTCNQSSLIETITF